MATALKVLIIVLAIAGLLLWAGSVLPPVSLFSVSAGNVSETQLVASPLPASDDRRVTLTGIVVYDRQVTPSVPYIAYQLPNGGTRTRQLIFRNEHGCSPSAGDLPCAAGGVATFPDLPEGATIRVIGVIDADQILVESLESR